MKITKMRLKNFKQYDLFEWDISKNANVNVIYGQNGAGKSTIIEALKFIEEIIMSRITNNFNIPNISRNLYSKYVTYETENEIEVYIEYINKENKYGYEVAMIKGDIISKEKLVKISKENEILFQKVFNSFIKIESVKNLFNNELIFFDEKFADSIISVLFQLGEKYPNSWNKNYDLFSIIDVFVYKMNLNKNENVETKFLFYDLIQKLIIFNKVRIRKLDFDKIDGMYRDFILKFSIFAREIDKTIIEVIPSKQDLPNNFMELSYKLMKKLGNGKIKEIPILLESKGTRQYFSYFYAIDKLQEKNNKTVTFFDEFGICLNETLIIEIYKKIIKVAKNLDKQVIISTHSAILLEKNMINIDDINEKDWNKEKWILDKSSSGKTIIKNLSNTNKRTNFRDLYLSGFIGGTHQGEIS